MKVEANKHDGSDAEGIKAGSRLQSSGMWWMWLMRWRSGLVRTCGCLEGRGLRLAATIEDEEPVEAQGWEGTQGHSDSGKVEAPSSRCQMERSGRLLDRPR